MYMHGFSVNSNNHLRHNVVIIDTVYFKIKGSVQLTNHFGHYAFV